MHKAMIFLLLAASTVANADAELKLVATVNNQPALKKVIWEIDSKAVSTSHQKTLDIKAGDYRVCANATCRNVTLKDGTKNTLTIEVKE